MGINLLETEKDGNCLINSILDYIGIDIKYNISLRKLIGKLIREANIDENIIRALNYNTKEEYINYITTDKNWCGYQELTYISIKYNILIAKYSTQTRNKNKHQWFFIYDQYKSNASAIEKKHSAKKEFADKSLYIHCLNQLLKAYSLYNRDEQYVVIDGKVVIIDENTGHAMPGRRWSDGLHQAIEEKEGLSIERETCTYNTITVRNYFRSSLV